MRVITHKFPHLDEMFAWWLLWYFGKLKFPNIKQATFIQMEKDFPSEDANTILIGCGYGRFDEHAQNGDEAKAPSCTTLVAKFLGVSEHPKLKQLIAAVEKHDSCGGNGGIFDLPNMLTAMRLGGKSEKEIVDLAFFFFCQLYDQQRMFLDSAAEFREKVRVRVLPCGVRMATLIGNVDQAPQIARSEYGAEADLFVQKNSQGVQIFIQRSNPIARKGIARLIGKLRYEEQKAAGEIKISDWRKLTCEGQLDEVPEWYFHAPAYQIFNGSLTKAVPPTRLKFGEIVQLASEAMTQAAEQVH